MTHWRTLALLPFLTAAFSSAQITAKVDAIITPSGVLQTTIVLSGSGPRSLLYKQTPLEITNSELFGTFFHGMRMQSAPVIADEVRFTVTRADFFLPIQRQQSLLLDVLALPTTGAAGSLREEIAVTIPPGFSAQAESRTNTERPFARYRSESKLEGGKLIVLRELEVQPGAETNRAEWDAFLRVVHQDQQHRFIIRRNVHLDLTDWLRAVPVEQAATYGRLAFQQREYEAAFQLMERAVQAKPDDANSWNTLGRALVFLGRLDQAQKAYEKQIALNPQDASAYNNLGLLQERLGQWDQSVQSFRKQLDVRPGDAAATANLPLALIHARRFGEAAEAASKALQLNSNSQQRVYLAVSRICGGALYSRTDFETALGPRPSASLLNNAAYYLSECDEKIELAEAYADRAVDQAKSAAAAARSGKISTALSAQNALAHYLDTYGWVLYKEGKLERALNLMKASAAYLPGGETYAHLAQAESKAGHEDLSAAYWSEAKLLEPGLVPPSIAARVTGVPPLSSDREWFPLKLTSAEDAASALAAGQAVYYFVVVNGNGEVQSARSLDAEDPLATKLLPLVRAIPFPAVQMDGVPEPAVYITRMIKDASSKLAAARSVGAEATAIAADLSPADFPLPDNLPAPDAAGVTPARITHKVEPRYSPEARRAGLEGTVLLKCVIGTDGKPRDFEVTRSLGMGLDEAALQATRDWIYQPAMKDGKPVSISTTLQVNFHVIGKWHSSRVEYQLPSGASRPILEKGGGPPLATDVSDATATLNFVIDVHGNPANVGVEKASDEEWGRDVTAALRKWKFAPALKNGSPVGVPCTIDFVRGN